MAVVGWNQQWWWGLGSLASLGAGIRDTYFAVSVHSVSPALLRVSLGSLRSTCHCLYSLHSGHNLLQLLPLLLLLDVSSVRPASLHSLGLWIGGGRAVHSGTNRHMLPSQKPQKEWTGGPLTLAN